MNTRHPVSLIFTLLMAVGMGLLTGKAYAQTNLGLHVTQAELDIWRQRAEDCDLGVPGALYCDDWTAIYNRATSWRNSPSARWVGNTTSTCYDSVGDTVTPSRTLDDGLRDAGFVYLVTGDTSYRDAVRTALLAQVAVAGTNWSNTTKWCTTDGNHDAYKEPARWCRRLLTGYSYIRATLSTGDRATLDAWFLAAGRQFDKVVSNICVKRAPNRMQNDYSVCGYACPGTLEGNTYYGGYPVYNFHRGWRAGVMFVGETAALVGVFLNDAALKDNAKRLFKEWVMFGVFPNGALNDMMRWNDYVNDVPDRPQAAIYYPAEGLSSATAIADAFARAGDTELYDYSTSSGNFGSQGGPKTLKKALQHFAGQTNGTVLNYASLTATTNPDKVIKPFGPNMTRVEYVYLASANIYYNDAAIKTAYSTTLPGSWSTSGYDVLSGQGGLYPRIRFMFGNMEGLVWPYSSTPPSSSIVGHWMLNETSGTTAADSSGNGNPGVLTGFSGTYWVPGQVGGGLNFDGIDDVVNAGSGTSLDNLPAVTVAAWIKPNSLGEGGYGRVAQKGNGTSPSAGWAFYLASGNALYFRAGYATTQLQRFSGTSVISIGAWQHVAVTWDGSTNAANARIYVNGTEVGYATTINGAGAKGDDAATNLRIGNIDLLSRTFDGILDDVRVYNGVLGASQIQALAQASPPTITTTTLPSGRTTISYGNQQLNASGGTTPYTWSIAAGTLPAGLGLSSGGVISGTPTTAGTSNFTGRVTDAASQFDDQALSINIATNSIPSITTTTLPGGSVGVAYNQTVASTGGDVALAWSVLSGTLPAGLALSNVNNQNATISGTPTTAGTSNFTLQLADVDNDTDTQALSIIISGAPSAPASLTATKAASPDNYRQINLSWTNVASETGYKIERKKGASGTYAQIATTGVDVVTYNDSTCGSGTQYYYRVRAYNGSGDSGYSPEANATTDEVTSGRQGHWKLDETSGTTAADSSGNANTGTLSGGPAWTAAKIGNGLNFDGVDDMVNCQSGASLDQLAAITVTAWIKADTMGEGGAGRIVQKGAGLYGGWRIYMLSTNQFGFAVDYATTDLSRNSANSAIPFGAWKHVVATWTGSATATNAKLYIDGVEATYSTTTNGSGARASDSAGNLQIGNESGLARTFDGIVDDVRVYNRVLTTAEIQAIHRAGL